MKNVIIRNLYAVGMHHWGGRELVVGPVYYCHPDPCRFDENAVALYADKNRSKKVAYIRREDAKNVNALFALGYIHGTCYVRAKATPEKFSKRTGPTQSISIGFIVRDDLMTGLSEKLVSMGHVFKIF